MKRRPAHVARLLCLLVVIALATCMVLPCAMAAVRGESGEEWRNNGMGLDKLTPTRIGLTVGGDVCTKGAGFMGRVAYLTAEQLQTLTQTNSPTVCAATSLGDCYISRSVPYSSYHTHVITDDVWYTTWTYHKLHGISIAKLAQNLGVNLNQKLSVTVYDTSDDSVSLGDAFNNRIDRYYFNPQGEAVDAVDAMLALYDSSVDSSTAPGPDSQVQLPDDPTAADITSPMLAYGQKTANDVNTCYWYADIYRVRLGVESPALTLHKADGKPLTLPLSRLVSLGAYKTSYSYYSAKQPGVQFTENVTGIPLLKLLSSQGIEVQEGQNLIAKAVDGYTMTIPYESLAYWFVGWDAHFADGSAVQNQSALRMYGPGKYGNGMLVQHLSEITVESDEPILVYGDVNGDNIVNAADALLVLQFFLGIQTPNEIQKKLGDVNCDNVVNAADALLILRYSLGLEEHLGP